MVKIWTDKYGKKVGVKEFITRWKSGIEGITQLQQINSQIKFTWIVILGISLGMIASWFAVDKLWWLVIILGGALGNTGVQQIGLYQKKKIFESIERGLE